MKTVEEIKEYLKYLKRKNRHFIKEMPRDTGLKRSDKTFYIIQTRIGVYSDLIDFIGGKDEPEA